MVAVRRLVESDFDGAYALYKELVGDIEVLNGNIGKERFAKILHFPGTKIFAAELDGRLISMATLHVMPNMTFGGRSYCMIENVVTLKAHRGQGHGRLVMNAALDAAWAEGSYLVGLLSGKYLTAKPFYERLGFDADLKYGMVIRRWP